MPPPAEEPICISIVLCDQVFRDEATKKLLLIGTFNRISASKLPAPISKMAVLLTLTNGKGAKDLSVSIEHEASETVVAEMRGPFEMTNPLAIVDIHIEFQNLVLPEAGKYWIMVRSGGKIIQQRPFEVAVSTNSREAGDDRNA